MAGTWLGRWQGATDAWQGRFEEPHNVLGPVGESKGIPEVGWQQVLSQLGRPSEMVPDEPGVVGPQANGRVSGGADTSDQLLH